MKIPTLGCGERGRIEGVSRFWVYRKPRTNLENRLPHLAAWRLERESVQRAAGFIRIAGNLGARAESGQTLIGTW